MANVTMIVGVVAPPTSLSTDVVFFDFRAHETEKLGLDTNGLIGACPEQSALFALPSRSI